MHWLKKTRWSVCLLSATAAVGLATPLESWAQIKPGNTFGVKKSTSSSSSSKSSNTASAPAAPAAEEYPAAPPAGMIQQTAAEPGGETAVQQELRRLYEESGREMPEVAAPYRANFQQPNTPAPQVRAADQSTMTNPAAQSQGGATPPAPSKPAAGSGNPVTRFFKKLMPGGNSKPTQTAATPAPQATRPTVPAAPPVGQPVQQPSRPTYAPYAGQQPRRLPNQEVANTNPPVQNTAPQLPLPPSPADYALAAPVVTATPVSAPVRPQITMPPAPAPAPAPQTTDDFRPFEPEVAPQAVARSAPLPDDDVDFAPPVIVDTAPMESPYQAIPLDEPAYDVPSKTVAEMAPQVAPSLPEFEQAETPVVTADIADAGFPDPFPEMSEEEADDELDLEDDEVPYAGLKLGEEPMDDAADPFAEPAESAPAQLAEAAPVKTDESAPALTAPLPLDESEALTELKAPGMPAAPQALEELVADSSTTASPFAQELTADELAKPVPVEPADAPSLPDLPMPELPPLAAPAVAAVTTPAAPGTAAAPTAKPISHQPTSEYDAKMALIRERGGMKGLKGFCPVTLRDDRELRDAQTEYASSFRGQKFHFSSPEAKAKFDLEPARYVPAAYGADVVVLIRDKDVAEGSLDYAAWYKGKLYLFATEEAHSTFVAEPAKYASPPGLE